MSKNGVRRIYELLEDFDTAMLVTHAQDQPLRARPMAIAGVEPHHGLWFFTARGSTKVEEIEHNEHVFITCQDNHDSYLWLSGVAELITNPDKVRDLWKEHYRAWFPKGPEDPSLILVFFRPERAEYWDNQGVKSLRYVFEAAKAYATGRKPAIDELEQHAEVALK